MNIFVSLNITDVNDTQCYFRILQINCGDFQLHIVPMGEM